MNRELEIVKKDIYTIVSKRHGDYLLCDHTEFCQLKVELGQIEVERERAYKIEKHEYKMLMTREIIGLRADKNPATGRNYSAEDAKMLSEKRLYDKYIELLALEATHKAIKNLYNDMNDFRAGIRMEVEVNFNASNTKPREKTQDLIGF